jgi:hypothetical protein
MKKVAQNMAHFYNSHPNTQPRGENTPNLVTLFTVLRRVHMYSKQTAKFFWTQHLLDADSVFRGLLFTSNHFSFPSSLRT